MNHRPGWRLWWACAAAAVIAGVAVAAARAWMCDDAYISFRYARNLVDGHGLVFNAGERVEGDTNFLWVLWTALGMALRIRPEVWSAVWGIACYGATLILLARRFPAAAVLGAAHVEWALYATSGLETSAFTLLAFAGYLLTADGRRPRAAGALLALASLTRPDGVIFAAVCGLWILAGKQRRSALPFAAGFLLLWGPATVWRILYYGDFFPNTYYAKSAWLSWWSQGLFYAKLYFTRYWPLLLAVPLVAAGKAAERDSATGGPRAGLAGRGGGAAGDARSIDSAALELALAVAYTAYVVRVGGDFMFGRLLLPVTPFLLLVIARALADTRPLLQAAAVAVLAAGLLFTPAVVDGKQGQRGIIDEHAFYTDTYRLWPEVSTRGGAHLRRLFAGLPVTVGFMGTQARLVYEARVPTAIECEAGLTDPVIARQPLAQRGRPGHEKRASAAYLIARGVPLVLDPGWAGPTLRLDDDLPVVSLDLGGGMSARAIYWDAPLFAELAARGARVPGLPAQIDAYLAGLAQRPPAPARVRSLYQRLRRFYFDHVSDPAREAPFRAYLDER